MTRHEGVLGVPVREMAALLEAVAVPQSRLEGAAAVGDTFSWAVLSTLIEPGDVDAVTLADALGPRRVLAALASEADADAVREALQEADTAEEPPSRERIASALERWRRRLRGGDPSRTFDRAARLGAQLLVAGGPFWPGGVDDLDRGRPLVLWARGDPGRIGGLTRSVALVGARMASGYGEHVAMESASGLSDRGFAVVSGGAYGIDAVAHRAALASDQTTVAFLAGGVDRLYPEGNAPLLRRIVDRGVILAELPPGSAPTRWRFLMRNRLIAAASQATVVIEAGSRSGSLNTAGHAAQLGRPLGAVPGPVTSPTSAGCHRLIREYDATCVTTADEMAELADPFTVPLDGTPPESFDARVLRELSPSRGRSRAELVTQTGASTEAIAAALGRLVVLGRVADGSDGWRALR